MSKRRKNKEIDEDQTNDPTIRGESILILTEFEKFIHEPLRLLIMAHLNAVNKADMKFLQKSLQVSWGNLSFHCTKLEEMEYIAIEKQIINKKSYTLLALTPAGREAFNKYRKKIKQILF